MKPSHLTSRARGTYKDDWGTPTEVLDLVRRAGPIALDMASSAEHNQRVQAKRYLTDAFSDWRVPLSEGVVFCNPPGPGKKVHAFWKLFHERVGPFGLGAFLFFNVDHLRGARHVDKYWLHLFRKRLRFVGAPSSASFSSALVVTQPFILNSEQTVRWGSICREDHP